MAADPNFYRRPLCCRVHLSTVHCESIWLPVRKSEAVFSALVHIANFNTNPNDINVFFNMFGCRTTLPNRFSVTRNFVFIPWDPSYEFHDDGDRLHLESPHGPSPWIVEEPSRYLYCHQKRSTRNDFKGQSKIYDNQFEYIRSDKYPANMQVGCLFFRVEQQYCQACLVFRTQAVFFPHDINELLLRELLNVLSAV